MKSIRSVLHQRRDFPMLDPLDRDKLLVPFSDITSDSTKKSPTNSQALYQRRDSNPHGIATTGF